VLALPEDMLAAVVEASGKASKPLQPYTVIQAAPSAADILQLSNLLAKAQNPFVILGGAGWTQAAAQQMQAFLEAWQLPFGGAFRFCDILDNSHPQYAGDVGIGINPKLAARVKNADVLLTIGARLGEMTTSGYTLIDSPRPQQALIHVYNQPDDLGRVYQGELMIASGMPQIAAALNQLPAPSHIAWAGAAQQAHADLLAWQSEPALMAREQPAVNQWQVVQTLKKLAPADTIITNGAGNFATWANRYWPYQGLSSCGHRTQLAPSSGSMGVGIPAAVAAKLEHPNTTVVCFAGDGDVLMTGQELATASQYGAGIVVLVFNNGMYGTIRMHQEKHFSARVHGTALVNPDFVMLATAYGGRGWLVTQTAQFEAALREALDYANSAKRPAVIELVIDPNIITPGATIAGMRAAV
jgi:acetolactate synthase-1/2/3 large subunit